MRHQGASTAGLVRALRILCCSPALAALLLTASPARADDAQSFELAKNRFDAGQYDEAHKRFSSLLEPSAEPCDRVTSSATTPCKLTDPDFVERARAFDAASLLALGQEPKADQRIEAILRQNPSYKPDPAVFPPAVVDRFTVVSGRLRTELEKIEQERDRKRRDQKIAEEKAREAEEKWIADVARMASEGVERNSRWLALLPFGVGQYQNGDIGLGVAFTVGEALLVGASLVSAGLVNYFATRDPNQLTPSGEQLNRADLNQSIRTAVLVNQATFTAWAVAAAAGIVQAQIAFKPIRILPRARTVPPRPKAPQPRAHMPTLHHELLGRQGLYASTPPRAQAPMRVPVMITLAVPGGVGLGLTGTF